MSNTNPTADYRKYDKGPNFKLIVYLFAIFIVLALAAALLFLHHDGTKVEPRAQDPRSNTRYVPAVPESRSGFLQAA